MAGRVAGKVAFITGAGRGQGRSHAIRLAEEGADIIAVDILEDYDTVSYAMATAADLAETVKPVEALDRRVIATKADVRDVAGLKKVLDEGVAELGKLDIVVANAGICIVRAWDEVTPAVWQDTIGTNLTGLEHDGRRRAASDRQRRRVDHLHKLHRGHQGPALLRPVRGGQAWRRRHRQDNGQRAR
jgi:NAD(P)-dependent dehydrogenase (short-subunit alcohol dehydrogenase family)